jgi:tRNA A37 threonylcarbamoyladenosine synthetase subunit TsaC/SUA5/YrdC
MPTVSLPEFIAAARSGDRLISFPTDTVPALAARPDVAGLIYEAKQRNQEKPLILMGAKADDLWAYVQGNDAEMQSWKTIAAKYFPGALTLVLPASDRLPTAMNPTDPTTIGIRVPNCGIARYILSVNTGGNRMGRTRSSGCPDRSKHSPNDFRHSFHRHQMDRAGLGRITSGECSARSG